MLRHMTSKRQRQEEAGRWLRRERERRGLRTTGALARRMGVSDSLVSRLETGSSAATDERAQQIAEALDMDLIEVRQNLGLWVRPESESPTPPVDAAVAEDEAWMDEQYAAWKADRDRKAALKALFRTGADHRDVV